jgi:hypothetical protein
MSQPQQRAHLSGPAGVPSTGHARYLIIRHGDVWLIKFEGEEYGPYATEREAILFAVDAAHKLGEQGEQAQVLQVDENGALREVWTHGRDPYPLNR